jgi:hypothetical protein
MSQAPISPLRRRMIEGASMRFDWDGRGARQRGFAGTRNARKHRRRLHPAAGVFSVVWGGSPLTH